MELAIREARRNDVLQLLTLYMQLHNNPMPEMDSKTMSVWNKIMDDRDHHIVIAELDGKIVSSCVIVIIPNMTHNQQPYALIENVVTDEKCRKKGYASMVMDYAKSVAKRENCYKIMLLTGSKEQSTLDFYKKCGYNSNDKTAFIQWL